MMFIRGVAGWLDYQIKRLIMLFAILTCLCLTLDAHANRYFDTDLPNGLMFIGLTDQGWQVFIVHNETLVQIDKINEPASAAYNATTGVVCFIDSSGAVNLLNARTNEHTLLFDGTDKRYTQPAFSPSGEWLYLVELPNGKSRQTNIVGWHAEQGEKHFFVRKRGAQFDPFARDPRFLFFTTASCVDDCPSMIWELWRRDNVSAEQVQLSLLNAVSRQPYVDEQNRIWFSSDAQTGEFKIWMMRNQVGAVALRQTFGAGKDSDPIVDNAGTLYFLRHTVNGPVIMQRRAPFDSNGMSLPSHIQSIRNLRYSLSGKEE